MSDVIGAAGPADQGPVKDVTVETFEEEVINASMTTPVIVDFWAEWCGPCKQLAPALEKAVAATDGAVKLVKIDIDKNQMLASQLRIQSVPTVYGFYQGRPVDGFMGAVPESEIKEFIARLIAAAPPAPAQGPNLEELLAAADKALADGDAAAAAQIYGEVAQAEPENLNAIAGLARCHLVLGDLEQARQLVDLAPADKQSDPAIASIKAALDLAGDGAGPGALTAAQESVNQNPDDLGAQFDLAGAKIAQGDMEGGGEALLEIIACDRDWNEEAARKKLLQLFDALGPMDPLTLKLRRKLSALLFS